LFASYKVPHPLQPYFLIKVQTDTSLTPRTLGSARASAPPHLDLVVQVDRAQITTSDKILRSSRGQ
ncbi:hypothetical protein JOM56_012551, partial [Amanita muscaria]